MTQAFDKDKHTPQDYDFDLIFDEGEVGGYTDAYFGLITDYQSPADILIRFPRHERGCIEPDAPHNKAKALALEVVKRWNAYQAERDLADQLAMALERIEESPHATQPIQLWARQALAAHDAKRKAGV